MTKNEYVLYVLSQLLSIIAFLFIGFNVFSFSPSGHLEASILKTILYAILISIAGLILPCIIFFNKIGGLFYLLKSIGFGILGLIAGLIIYIVINSLTFGSIPIYISNVVLPGLICLCGLVIGSYFGIKKVKKDK